MLRVSKLLRALAAVAALSTGVARAQPTEGRPAAPADFDGVNPGIGFGWFGISDIPIGAADGPEAVSAPVLGIRWWMGQGLGPFRAWGLDLGLGIGRQSTDLGAADDVRTGFLVHAGLPLVLATSEHVAVEFVPELNVGIARGEDAANGDLSGSRLDLGVRAGAEVFFGFMGLPRLSLEGSVGAFLSRQSATYEPAGGGKQERTTTSFGTQRFSDPWDIFRGTVAARYYF